MISGGRRTYGSALLVVSSVLMIAWLRSRVISDEIILETHCYYRKSEETHLIRSHDNALRSVYRVWFSGGSVREEELWRIPYAVLVLPLTLLSAYLILRPGSRKR